MRKVRKIAVVTGTRAEYGILKPLLKKVQSAKDLELSLYVTGMHLLKSFGSTVKLVKKDGFTIHRQIPMYWENEKDKYGGMGLSRGIAGFTKAFAASRPDMALVFGDRFEALVAAVAAATLNIPVGHIHGGDKTDSGHIDESTRHAITRYSHIHFAPTPAAARRLLRMGEQSFRVHNVGTLSIDSVLETPQLTKQAVCKTLGLNRNKEIIVCLFNPLPIESESMGAHARELFAAIRELEKQTIVIYPNNDPGSEAIIREIEKIGKLTFVSVAKNLPSEQYINLLRHANVLVGNSSSGIVEAPTFKLPVINVGMRNVGREHALNVIFTDPKKTFIIKAIEKALYDKKFKANIRRAKNPYGTCGAADAIVSMLKKIHIDKRLMLKKVTY